ncbi:hypothetical protein FT641_18390 [Bacillus paranthracis]|uniref:hypothetical protein n=1 Tax=Bacillus paranthracis TaxID=2026186 RepID=UPI00187B0D35|nr:hypothetical protein [Bacillus paranthracis]MBE7114467.1 hypothetical protein [Bacillus paranthracis]MBE7154659.1 hypothetical protein [Bacillus paranthracis]
MYKKEDIMYCPYIQEDGKVTVVRIVNDNKKGYADENFMYDGDDLCLVCYSTEQGAIDWVNKNIKKEFINPKYLG